MLQYDFRNTHLKHVTNSYNTNMQTNGKIHTADFLLNCIIPEPGCSERD